MSARLVLSVWIAAALAFIVACGEAQAQGRRALLVGVDSYRNVPKLLKAVGDAQAMKRTLERSGFEADLVANPERSALNLAISAFTRKLQPGDVALVQFSGHGVALDGENYLLPADVPSPGTSDKELLKSEAIALTALIDRIRASGVRTLILVIDACRDNPYAKAGSRSIGSSRGLAQIETPRGPGGVFIMYSAGYGQTAADRLSDNDPEPTSVYTRTLLKKVAVEGKALTDIAREVREDVEALAATVGHNQRPAYYDELSGAPFYFVPPRAGAAVGGSLEMDLVFWTSIKDSRNVGLFREYLEKFGERAQFASIARYYIQELEGGAARREPTVAMRTAPSAPASTPTPAPAAPAMPPPQALATLPPPAPVQPSFECGGTLGMIEKAICADHALALRDRVMSDLYYKVADTLPTDARTAFRTEQRDWLRQRRACEQRTGDQLSACIAESYDGRIATFRGKLGLPATVAAAPAAVDVRAVPPATPAVPMAAPSFDCAKANGAIDKAICADAALAAKDRTLGALYDRARRAVTGAERTRLADTQRAWLRIRNACAEPDLAPCIGRAYDTRIRELEAAARR